MRTKPNPTKVKPPVPPRIPLDESLDDSLCIIPGTQQTTTRSQKRIIKKTHDINNNLTVDVEMEQENDVS